MIKETKNINEIRKSANLVYVCQKCGNIAIVEDVRYSINCLAKGSNFNVMPICEMKIQCANDGTAMQPCYSTTIADAVCRFINKGYTVKNININTDAVENLALDFYMGIDLSTEGLDAGALFDDIRENILTPWGDYLDLLESGESILDSTLAKIDESRDVITIYLEPTPNVTEGRGNLWKVFEKYVDYVSKSIMPASKCKVK